MRTILAAVLLLLVSCTTTKYSYTQGPYVVQLFDSNGKAVREIQSESVIVDYLNGSITVDGITYKNSYSIHRR